MIRILQLLCFTKGRMNFKGIILSSLPQRTKILALLFRIFFVNLGALLLSFGANVNAKDINGQTPLHIAALFGDVATASLLLDADADISVTDVKALTPLQIALLGDKAEVVNLLSSTGNPK